MRWALAAVIAVCAATGLSASAAPRPLQIAFVGVDAQGGHPELSTMDVRGRGVRRLYADAGLNGYVAYEPGGGSMVAGTRSGLVVVPRDGGAPRLLVPASDQAELDPAWSPDGRWISFLEEGTLLFVVHPDGRGLKQLARGLGEIQWARWAPDSKRLAIVWKADGAVRGGVLGLDGRLRHLGRGICPQSWSPDGRLLAFASCEIPTSVWVERADGTHRRRLTDWPEPFRDRRYARYTWSGDVSPRWSPDGRTIAFVRRFSQRGRGEVAASLATIGVDGRHLRTVGGPTAFDGAPAWSPDGRFLLFTRVCATGACAAVSLNVYNTVAHVVGKRRGSILGDPVWRP